ncbi:hypothetical protein [Faecalimonas sp.]
MLQVSKYIGGNDGVKKVIRNFEFISRILEILRLMEKQAYPCSAWTLEKYLKMIMKELNPEEEMEWCTFGTPDYVMTRKFPHTIGRFYKDIIAGDVSISSLARDFLTVKVLLH